MEDITQTQNRQEIKEKNIEQATINQGSKADPVVRLSRINEIMERKEKSIIETQSGIAEIHNQLNLSQINEIPTSVIIEQDKINKLNEEKNDIEVFVGGKENLKNKEGVDFVFEQKPELIQIGTKEQYLDYLNNIFPDSKIKNIAYHDSDIGGIEDFNKTNNGIFATGDKNWWQKRLYKYALLINTQNPKIIDTPINSDVTKDFIENPINHLYDSLITTGNSFDVSEGVYVLREPNQIHILGFKNDVENFKTFISKHEK